MPANLPRLGDGAGGGQKVSGRRKDPLASRYSGLRIRERPSGIFSYYLEAAIPLILPIFPVFPRLCRQLCVPNITALSHLSSAGHWISDFRMAITEQEGNRRTRDNTVVDFFRLSIDTLADAAYRQTSLACNRGPTC